MAELTEGRFVLGLGAAPPANVIAGNAVRLLPHFSSTDGFFVAVMERTRQ